MEGQENVSADRAGHRERPRAHALELRPRLRAVEALALARAHPRARAARSRARPRDARPPRRLRADAPRATAAIGSSSARTAASARTWSSARSTREDDWDARAHRDPRRAPRGRVVDRAALRPPTAHRRRRGARAYLTLGVYLLDGALRRLLRARHRREPRLARRARAPDLRRGSRSGA